MSVDPAHEIGRQAHMLAALGAEPRLRIVRLLLAAHPEGFVVGELGSELGLPPSTLSHHLDKLKYAGSVTVRRERVSSLHREHQGPSGNRRVPVRRVLHPEQGDPTSRAIRVANLQTDAHVRAPGAVAKAHAPPKPGDPAAAVNVLAQCHRRPFGHRRVRQAWARLLGRIPSQAIAPLRRSMGCAQNRLVWLGREDSNLRMAESKSAALPLGDAPMRRSPVGPAKARGP